MQKSWSRKKDKKKLDPCPILGGGGGTLERHFFSETSWQTRQPLATYLPRENGSSGDKSLLVLHLFVRTALFKCEWNRFHMDHSAWEPCAGRIKGDKAYKWEQGLAGYGLDRQSHVTNSPILPGSPLLSQWLAMSVKYYSYVGFYVIRQQQFQ